MDILLSPQGQRKNLEAARKSSLSLSRKDICVAVREGSLGDVELALALLKKNGGSINSRNGFGLTPLHIATWRNHIPILRRLLDAGADPDARDGESGWSSLHRALHFGHLAVASVLLQSGASIVLEDTKSRIPADLLSGSVLKAVGGEHNSVATEMFSWGSGANYQLGTGNVHIQKLPCKVDSLHGSFVKLISAAKFHSVAVTAQGEVYTWGFGRGGRLGHPDFDIHSGQAAVITPRQVTSGLGARRVRAVAAAKHHTVLATENGEVFTWGSNREGQLGYTSVDTQPTPRRVSSLKARIVAVAAANKHTAVVSECGEVFTWGCNKEGQLGYGTSNSASNYTPRLVEYLKGKVFIGVAAAKYHTIVLGGDGEVYTWGHRLVNPRRVVVTRNLKKFGSTPLKFHRWERLHVVSVAAGLIHSMALTADGAVFYWVSSDPDLKCQQVYALCGKDAVSISAGKYWTSVVTAVGDTYVWDGKNGKDKPPAVTRLHGVKKATSVSVGETHILIVASLYHPVFPPNVVAKAHKLIAESEVEELDEDFMFNKMDTDNLPSAAHDDSRDRPIPSLKSLCEKVAAKFLVEPRNSIQLLEIADSLGAEELRKHCEEIVVRNLDYIVTVSAHAFTSASLYILANLEKVLDQKSSESWSCRRLPTPTATFPVIINSEDEELNIDMEMLRSRDSHASNSTFRVEKDRRLDSFLQPYDDNPNHNIIARTVRKKLQQIEMLEAKQSRGHHLDVQQIAKLKTRSALESSLAELGVVGELAQAKSSSPVIQDGKGNKRADVSRKKNRKNKQRGPGQVETVSGFGGTSLEPSFVKDFSNVEISQALLKEDDAMSEASLVNQDPEENGSIVQKKEAMDLRRAKTTCKKKNRKGGLSLFLSGALDEMPKFVAPPPPPPKPKPDGPVWGGAKTHKGSASLRAIQDEQSKVNPPTQKTDLVHLDGRHNSKIPLASNLPSKPISVVQPQASPTYDTERNPPSWASGTPPHLSRPSLRDIQMQQGKHPQNLSHSPKIKTSGFSVSTSQGSPSDSPGMNRWFKPETDATSSIRSIQIEEKAIKDLKRFYSSVKIVKNQT